MLLSLLGCGADVDFICVKPWSLRWTLNLPWYYLSASCQHVAAVSRQPGGDASNEALFPNYTLIVMHVVKHTWPFIRRGVSKSIRCFHMWMSGSESHVGFFHTCAVKMV